MSTNHETHRPKRLSEVYPDLAYCEDSPQLCWDEIEKHASTARDLPNVAGPTAMRIVRHLLAEIERLTQ